MSDPDDKREDFEQRSQLQRTNLTDPSPLLLRVRQRFVDSGGSAKAFDWAVSDYAREASRKVEAAPSDTEPMRVWNAAVSHVTNDVGVRRHFARRNPYGMVEGFGETCPSTCPVCAPRSVQVEVTDEMVDRVAVAIAVAADSDYWVEEIAEWESSEQWEREAHPDNLPGYAYADRAEFRKQARAALAAAFPPPVTESEES